MGSKGPSGNTTTTVQQQNPIATAQLPYLTGLWGAAQGLQQQPSPNINALQNYAEVQGFGSQPFAGNIMPYAMQQYVDQLSRGIPAAGQANQLTANAANAINQGLGYSGALSGVANNALGTGGAATSALTGLAPGELAGMSGLAGMAAANPALFSGLRGLASGAYIDPSTNPAYAGMIQSATQPLVNQYQTATAPQVASQFEGAGRYGSGAATNAQGQAQYGLGQALSNAVAGITNNAYNTGLQATLGGGQALGNIYNQALSNAGNLLNQGYTTAGNLLNQGYGTGLGYLNAGLTGLAQGAGAAQAGYGTANTALTGGGQLLNQGYNALSAALGQAPSFAGYPEQQFQAAYNAPWLPLQNLSGILGGAIGGTGTSTTSQPYYSNTGANILGGLTGGLGIANTIGGASGIFPGAIASALSGF